MNKWISSRFLAYLAFEMAFSATMGLCFAGIGYVIGYDFYQSFLIGFLYTFSVFSAIYTLMICDGLLAKYLRKCFKGGKDE